MPARWSREVREREEGARGRRGRPAGGAGGAGAPRSRVGGGPEGVGSMSASPRAPSGLRPPGVPRPPRPPRRRPRRVRPRALRSPGRRAGVCRAAPPSPAPSVPRSRGRRRPRRVSGRAAWWREPPRSPRGQVPRGPRSLGSRGVPAARRLPSPALGRSPAVGVVVRPTVPPRLCPPSAPRAPASGRPRPPTPLALPARSPLPAAAPRPPWREGPGTRVRGGSPGGKVGSGLVACVGREGARPASRGPWAQWGRRSAAPGGGVRSRAGSAEACVRPRVAAGGAGGVEAVAARHYPLRLVRFFGFPPIQVPSASRRGGLKTPGGPRPSALGRGGRARGESGGLALLPQTPPRRAGGRRAAVAAAVGRGRPRRPSCHRVRVRAPRPRARREPPGACGVSEHGPAGPVPDAPSSNLPTSRSLVSLCLPGRPEAPSGDVPCQGRALPPPCGGTPPFKLVRLLAVDHSARASMKNAASCEN